jgi:MFS family permease
MDHSGAVLGPLLATALIAFGFSIRQVFFAALVPSVFALLAVAWVRERPRAATPPSRPAAPREALSPSFPSYLAIIAVFAVANSSDAFLLLRANEIGVATVSLPLLWTVLHISRVASTHIGGRLADRFPRARLIAAGWVVFAFCYASLGLAHDTWIVWMLFIVYGVHTGLCEPAERALIHDMAPESSRGRAFGMFHGVVGACAIPAGLLMGWLWQAWSARAALTLAAGVALVAAAALVVWERRAATSLARLS